MGNGENCPRREVPGNVNLAPLRCYGNTVRSFRNCLTKNMCLKKREKELIIGFILGDCSVERNGANCRLRFDHSRLQLDSCRWKHRILSPHCGKFTEYDSWDKRTKKYYAKCRFYTWTRPYFNVYRELFYPAGEKQIPESIGDLLTSEWTLAAWFLDDGSRRTDCAALRLHTNSYRKEECSLLSEVLEKNFSISSTLHRARPRNKIGGEERDWILHIGGSGAERLDFLIRPIIKAQFPQFLYKCL